MDTQHPTPTQIACHLSHRRLVEALSLRQTLNDRFQYAFARLRIGWGTFDEQGYLSQLQRCILKNEHRIERRRIQWLALQRDVFVELASQARSSTTRDDARCSSARVADALSLAALRSLVGRR